MATTATPTPDAEPGQRRHSFLTPDRLLLGLFVAEVILLPTERFRWFAFNRVWTILIGLAVAFAVLIALLSWFAWSLIRRRRFQFSLLSLLLLAVAIAIPCGWVTVTLERRARQQKVAEAIRKLGGAVEYDSTFSTDRPPQWLPALVKREYLADSLWVCLPELSDAGLQRLNGLAELRSLQINGPERSPIFASLVGPRNRRDLETSGSQVSRVGLEHLRGLTQLRDLSLTGVGIHDEDLQQLSGLTELKVLSLANTKITDAGLEHLKGLTQLCFLDLTNTHVSDVGLKHLTALTRLWGLYLGDTQITDAGLLHLAGLTHSVFWTLAELMSVMQVWSASKA